MLQFPGKYRSGPLLVALMMLGCSRNQGEPPAQPSIAAPVQTSKVGVAPDAEGRQVVSPGAPMQLRAGTQQRTGTNLPGLVQKATSGANIVPLKNPDGDTDAISALQAGATAPDFVSHNLEGDEVRLSDWRDNVVVLDFWATWCRPCLESLPHVQEVAKSGKDQGVIVVAICTGDTREKFEQFVKANQAKYPDIVFASDPNEKDSETFDQRASRRLYGVGGIPIQFVIARDGKIAVVVDGYEKDDHRLEEALLELGVKRELAQPAKASP